ncbi:MAG: type IV pilus biogenesis/stability protein PilW, partial [Endozoicomonas sp.]
MGSRPRLRMELAVLLCASLQLLTGCVSTGGRSLDEGRAVVDYMNLAKGYLKEGYTEKAVKPLERALEIEPDSADVYGVLGMTYQMQGEDHLAEKSFKRALSIDSDASDIRNNYGAFLFSRKRLDDAYEQFDRASEDVGYSRRSRTFENMGIVALQLNKRTLAKQHFTRALRLNGSLSRASLELTEIYKSEGDDYQAWKYYQLFSETSAQSARTLLLGIELATINDAHGKAASYVLRLERLYPGS